MFSWVKYLSSWLEPNDQLFYLHGIHCASCNDNILKKISSTMAKLSLSKISAASQEHDVRELICNCPLDGVLGMTNYLNILGSCLLNTGFNVLHCGASTMSFMLKLFWSSYSFQVGFSHVFKDVIIGWVATKWFIVYMACIVSLETGTRNLGLHWSENHSCSIAWGKEGDDQGPSS